ncbi:hypothetical protein PEBR_08436 [Penicillium brasilianum]|uniref:DUF7703 domain-containing protein n=1 Tax=Penicillium brasilianum TaxID=104259 RepID=A0A1S9S172_PENBI|nr:hypothetical protein PEBR_08436 [Penicillium brasilianum]
MSSQASGVGDSLLHPDPSKIPVRTEIFAAFAAIAWYNAIELIVLCFVSFKRRRGCYFWSLLVASSSIVPHCLGYFLLFFPTGVSPYICVTLIVFSWYGMVTGQSMVLWSRLHLVLQNTKILWGVLGMIIVDAILLHIPTTVLLYGTAAAPLSVWARGYGIMEHIQLVGFCIQELIISGLYVWETVKLLRLRPQGRPHGILHQLLVINIIILLLDVAIVVIEYVGYYAVQVMFKPVAYSIKLKLEYAILGKLVAIAQGMQTYNDDDGPSSTREMTSCPSSQETPLRPGLGPDSRRLYSFPWFWDTSHQSSCTSSGI